MYQYEKTHPWITFSLDLEKASYNLWLLMGEAQSKCEHIAGVPLRPDINADFQRLYLAKGILATSAIEGNTLTEREVLERIEGKKNLPQSKEYLGQEIDNLLEAYEVISNEIIDSNGPLKFSVERIKKYNRMILNKLTLDDGIIPGEIRTYSVGVGSYRGVPFQDCEYLLEQLCGFLNDDKYQNIFQDYKIALGLIKAIMAHIYLAWIHPFGDGNGRTARLIEYQMLLEAGIAKPAANLLSNHYNLTRTEYYHQLELTTKKGDVLPFLIYALKGFIDGLKIQIDEIRKQQLDITWRSYIQQSFQSMIKKVDNRKRIVLLELSKYDGFISIREIRELTPKTAQLYFHKTDKTISRDLHSLEKMELIEVTSKGVRVRKENILAFMPLRKKHY